MWQQRLGSVTGAGSRGATPGLCPLWPRPGACDPTGSHTEARGSTLHAANTQISHPCLRHAPVPHRPGHPGRPPTTESASEISASVSDTFLRRASAVCGQHGVEGSMARAARRSRAQQGCVSTQCADHPDPETLPPPTVASAGRAPGQRFSSHTPLGLNVQAANGSPPTHAGITRNLKQRPQPKPVPVTSVLCS